MTWDFGLEGFDLYGGDAGASSLSGGDFSGSFGDVALQIPDLGSFEMPDVGGGYGGGADILGNYGGATGMGGAGSGPFSPNQSIAGPEAGGGGGGFGLGDVANALGTGAKAALPAAQLGLAGMGLYQGFKGAQQAGDQAGIIRENQRRQGQIAGQQQQMAGTAQAYADPLFKAGEDARTRAMAGEVPAGVQAQIDQWAQGAKQMAQQRAASSGQGNSTQLTQWLQWIDQQAQAMKGSWVQSQMNWSLNAANAGTNTLGTGATALGGAANTTNQAAQFASQQQNELQNLIGQANQVLGRLNASGAR